MQSHKPRNSSIDVLKGITALLMILAHTIYFAGYGADKVMGPIVSFINLTTFTVLLFLSGSGLYLSYLRIDLSKDEFKAKKGQLLHRAFKLLLSYYLISLIGMLPQLIDGNNDVVSMLLRLFLFLDIPNYVEFLIPFIAFYLAIYYLRPAIKSITNSLLLTFLFSALFYLTGSIYYQMTLPAEFSSYKSILFGHSDWYSFPIFQYAPVFFLGAYYGKLLALKDKSERIKRKNYLILFILSLVVLLPLLSLFNINSTDLTRWPPSLYYIILGTFYTLLMLKVISASQLIKGFKPLRFIGNNLFDYYIIHLVLLYAFKYFSNVTFQSSWQVLLYSLLIIVLGTLIVFFSNSHTILEPLRKKFSLRSFDSVYFRLFYVFLGVWFIGLLAIRFASNYDSNLALLISNTFIDVNYEEKVTANFTMETALDRKMVFIIDSNDPYFDEYKAALFEITVNNKGYDYKGVDILIDGVQVEHLEKNPVNVFNYRINPRDYAVGAHRLEARVTGSSLKGQEQQFIVSYPLFVTWTIDWEGYDISDANLKAMDNISATYGIPMVQLVTPRVFEAADVSAARKQVLKDWVLNRYAQGDEIGMHLHMHYDLFRACNLPYRTTPKWDSRANGHDVPTSAYTPEEFAQLLDCSLSFFEKYSFPKPVTYRAGGWFIDLKNLKVLPEKGFKIDTSARDYYQWGNLTGFWDVDVTRKPYPISALNQNQEDLNNNFNLIEVPNNGSDSTNNQSSVMKDRFNQNYPDKGTPLSSMQVLTYMSHPHWFTKYDNATMRDLMNYVSEYAAKDDKGPVIFTTIEKIYDLRSSYDR
jgi:peptidoglycan/LPS O-acetylase OafA/YrhL